jgi:hypothetical protein
MLSVLLMDRAKRYQRSEIQNQNSEIYSGKCAVLTELNPEAIAVGSLPGKGNQRVRRLWWEREDLAYGNGRLYFGGRDLMEFVQSAPAPLYHYNSGRVRDNLSRLEEAAVCLHPAVYFRMVGSRTNFSRHSRQW